MTWLGKVSAFLLGALSILGAGDDALADVSVPVDLQAQLTLKLSAFDRNFVARSEGGARVLVVTKASDAESADVGSQFAHVVLTAGAVAGVKVTVATEPLTTAGALAEHCRAQRIALVYLSTHLDGDILAVTAALAGVDVLTVGANGTYAGRGAVVAFELEEGRPRIVVNLTSARAQNVSFRSELLKLAQVIGTPAGAAL
jgi:hypothetical protein